MKTKHLIKILRCPGDHRVNCATCEVLESCKELAGQDLYEVCAERFEQLLDNLRTTQEKLQTIEGERDIWRKRYMKTQNGLKNIVHENELLDNLMN